MDTLDTLLDKAEKPCGVLTQEELNKAVQVLREKPEVPRVLDITFLLERDIMWLHENGWLSSLIGEQVIVKSSQERLLASLGYSGVKAYMVPEEIEVC